MSVSVIIKRVTSSQADMKVCIISLINAPTGFRNVIGWHEGR